MISVLATDLAYWQETLIKVVIGLIAVLIPAGTIVYLYLFNVIVIFTVVSIAPRDKWTQDVFIPNKASGCRIVSVGSAIVVVLVSTVVAIAPTVVAIAPTIWVDPG